MLKKLFSSTIIIIYQFKYYTFHYYCRTIIFMVRQYFNIATFKNSIKTGWEIQDRHRQ